ncbi:ketoacyl-synthetase C-terminal extension domain-containing protein, partial [Nocardia nova]|uniref:ketoacyl-synthetase C-terminal extension domain-containing protein n=2 Tax=Nocardia nova TaxID=37330 RepID=UPI002B4AF3DE
MDWSAGHVGLLTEGRVWPDLGRPRRAAVSSFGISGTNAHVILEQAPRAEPARTPDPEPMPVIPWLVSARTRPALAAQVARLSEFVTARPESAAADIGFSLTHRSALEYRAAAVGRDRDELLAALAQTDATPAAVSGGVVLVFPGQGSQWVGMGRVLLGESRVFAERFGECEVAL